jgi:hypothetical protein
MFTESFGNSAYPGETIECEADGFRLVATIHHDDDADAPWKREDGHGDVSEWTRRAKAPGELVLAEDRGSRLYYDFAGAVAKAKAEGWDAPPYGEGSAGERAERAARADFERLRKWCAGHWFYVGLTVTAHKADVQLTGDYDNALWGIESDAGGYLREVANDLLHNALEEARAKLNALCSCVE